MPSVHGKSETALAALFADIVPRYEKFLTWLAGEGEGGGGRGWGGNYTGVEWIARKNNDKNNNKEA